MTAFETFVDREREASGSLEVRDGGAVRLESFDERAAGALFHASVAGDDGGLSRRVCGGVGQRADGGEEASCRASVSEVQLLALWRGGERALTSMDHQRLSSIFPLKTSTLITHPQQVNQQDLTKENGEKGKRTFKSINAAIITCVSSECNKFLNLHVPAPSAASTNARFEMDFDPGVAILTGSFFGTPGTTLHASAKTVAITRSSTAVALSSCVLPIRESKTTFF